MRNLNKVFISTGYMMFLVFFFIVNEILCNYCIELELINSYDNTPYNKYAIFMNISSEKEDCIDLSKVTNTGLYGCALLKYNEDSGLFNEVIYCDANAVDIIVGDENILDFRNKFAVVGCDSGYIKGDLIVIEGKEYLVQGILCKHVSDAINRGVFYCKGNISEVLTESTYVLLASNEKFVLSGYEKIEDYLNENDVKVKCVEMSRAKFADYINYKKVIEVLIIILILFYIALIVAIRKIWLKLHYSEIYILNVLGYTNIKYKVKMEYLITWISAYFFSVILFGTMYYNRCRDFFCVLVTASMILILGVASSANLYKDQRYIM